VAPVGCGFWLQLPKKNNKATKTKKSENYGGTVAPVGSGFWLWLPKKTNKLKNVRKQIHTI